MDTTGDILIAAQIAAQTMALLSVYQMGSKSPRKRLQGFILLLLSNIPVGYTAYATGLYINLMMVPLWTFMAARGIGNCIKIAEEEDELYRHIGESDRSPEGEG